MTSLGSMRSAIVLCLLLQTICGFRTPMVRPCIKTRPQTASAHQLQAVQLQANIRNQQLALHNTWRLDQPVIPQPTPRWKTLAVAGTLLAVLARAMAITTPALSLHRLEMHMKQLPERFFAMLALVIHKMKLWVGWRGQQAASSSSWHRCRLQSYADLSDRYRRYTFALDDRTVTLSPCQKVTLCAADRSGELVKDSYLCLQTDTTLDVYTTKQRSAVDVMKHTANPSIGCKKGAQMLAYKGKDTIRSLQLVASGLGIVPVLSLLRTVLDNEAMHVEATLLWVNDIREDFILDEEVAALERAHPHLEVRRLTDAGIHDSSSSSMSVLNALPPYREGAVAVVAGSQGMRDKLLPSLDRLQYPEDNVIYVPAG